MENPWKRLQLRLLTSIVLGTSVFALIAAILAFQLGFDRAIRNGRASLEGLITAVEKTAAIGAYTADTVVLQEIVDGLARDPNSLYVEIRSTEGGILASRQLGAGREPDWSDTANYVERTLVSPFHRSESVGSLRIMANRELLQAQAKREATTLAAMMIVQTLLVAFLVYLLAARFVSRPIVNLAQNLRGMKPGTSQRIKRLPRHDADEIGTLVDGANALLEANEIALLRERELRADVEAMQAQYRKIFNASSAGIFVLAADGRMINCNPTVLRIAGMSETEPDRFKGMDLVGEIFAYPDKARSMMAEAAWSGETVSADLELRPQGGRLPWVHCLFSVQPTALNSLTTPPQARGLVEGVMYDITERKQSESVMLHQAEHDDLTGLKNRLTSERMVDRFLADAANSRGSVSILYIDLDGFKLVNDLKGHKAGDQVLIECAVRMRTAVRRSTDLVGRVGGDEFLIALNNVGPADHSLTEVAQALIDALRSPFNLENDHQVHIGVSIGIACYPQHGLNRIVLMQEADNVMYEVKRTGKNSFALALPDSNSALN
jgi:diguanylate cyclase (GGDEF)-like protein/PAS domain S-box-containing protein